MDKRWTILSADPDKTQRLQQALNIHPLLCQLLVQRGIDSYAAAKDFFRPALENLHDPWLMKDMDKAVDRILMAINNQEKILVYGDYDVDGTTSVAMMYQFLRTVYPNVDFYIPHRYREGYGVSKAGIDFARDNGFTLIISLDCGIKSVDLIGYARDLKIDFVVCDHHLPDETLPPAIAILNPKQQDCPYPFKDLCGCGVGFKLIMALVQKRQLPQDAALVYLDLVATAIAADIVSMTGENRILAFYGLKKANDNPNHGIKALAELSGLKLPMTITNLVFMIAPRINAAGRMDDARKAVELFIAPSLQEAMQYANLLHSDNSDRKEADSSITEEALAKIRENPSWSDNKSTLVFDPGWHKGVVGIVASRLIEHYHRPTIVLTRSGDYAAGSARSVPGFNLYEAVHACRELLLGYGGHFAAAGMTLEIHQVDNFREKFEAVVAASIEPQMLIPEILIDAVVRLEDLSWNFYNIISQMEPYGPDNTAPVFIVRGVTDTGFSKIVKERHLRFSVRQVKQVITGIGFGMAGKHELVKSQQPLDIVFRLNVNEWNNEKTLQMHVLDCRAAELPN